MDEPVLSFSLGYRVQEELEKYDSYLQTSLYFYLSPRQVIVSDKFKSFWSFRFSILRSLRIQIS